MGVIYMTILALKDRYDYLLQASKEVNTYSHQVLLEELIFQSFEALRPLRGDYVVAGDLKNAEGKVYEQIGVGEFIRQRSSGDTYGSNFKPGSDWSRRQFVDIIRSHGEMITPHVGASKREDFGRLVQISKDFKFYDELTVSLEVDPPLTVHRHSYGKYSTIPILELDDKKVEKLILRSSNSDRVIYNKVDEERFGYWPDVFDLSNEANVAVVEDLIDYLVKLYGMASELVDVTKRHNEPLAAEMGTLASVYNISRRLT